MTLRRGLVGLLLTLALTVGVWLGASVRAGAEPVDPAVTRIEAARAAFAMAKAGYGTGTVPLESVYTWSVRLAKALRAPGGNTGRAPADHLQRMRDLQVVVARRVAAGAATQAEKTAVTYFVAEAEAWNRRGEMD